MSRMGVPYIMLGKNIRGADESQVGLVEDEERW